MRRLLCAVFVLTQVSDLLGRPNILLIVSEDNGPELGCYGEPFVRTPILDKLAANGVLFERAYVPQAGCSQSRAALLTGLYPREAVNEHRIYYGSVNAYESVTVQVNHNCCRP